MSGNSDVKRELFNPERQSMGAATLAKFQRVALEREWKRIWEQPIPFYKNKFEAAGLSAKEMPPLDEIPMTIKDELRADDAANPPWGTWRALSVEGSTCLGASTGTTGKPMLYLRGKKDMEIYREVVQRNWWREGLRPYGRTTNSWPGFIYSAMGGSVGSIWDWPAMEIPVGPPMNIDMAKEHIALWQTLFPTNYMMSGSQLQIYEQAAQELGTSMAKVFNGASVAFMEAMCQFEEPRRQFEERFNIHIFNISGASELPGAAVTDCKYHTGFHTNADYVIAQIVDPATGREVAAGGRGHLVWSAIGGDSFWLRYNVEDWAESVPGNCPCGETGLRYRLLGRGGDLQIINGRQLFPLDVQLALMPFGAPEFLVEKGKKPNTLCVRVETSGDGTDLADALRKTLGVPTELTPIPVGSLPRAFFKQKRA